MGAVEFSLNGRPVRAEGGRSLLSYLRDEAGLTAAKNACGEGACGACSVIVDGALLSSCVVPLEKVAGKSVLSLEGLAEAERELYARAFADAGAVQCGFCTPGMVMAAKALLDREGHPGQARIRAAVRRNLCRCTGYAKIVAGIALAAERRAAAGIGVAAGTSAAGGGPAGDAPAAGVGSRLRRIDAVEKARGEAAYCDDLSAPGMLHGAVLRAAHPRALLVSLDVSRARALPGVAAVATWADIPGERFIGHVIDDWPTLVAPGEETRYVGDAVALVAAETREIAREALGLIEAAYEVLEPVRGPEAALEAGAPRLHPGGNVLSRIALKRGDAAAALARSAHVARESYSLPFGDHAFMEPECALAFPPDTEGIVRLRTGEQNVYDGRRYVARTLGLPEEKVVVSAAYVGGGFGGKEDQSVQHHAALLAWLSGRPVKLALARAESTAVHVKRHAMKIEVEVGCDGSGRILGARGRIVADTGAYASLGGPVLHRAVTHLSGPYAYGDIDVEGVSVYTNNPPAGAFRGFGVPQVAFAFESTLDLLAAKAGISPWEIRWLNAVRPGDALPNGQIAGPDAALEECLLAARPAFEAARGRAGIACGFKNTGLGVGHPDVGRCSIRVHADRVEILTGAACMGQGLGTALTQIASASLGIGPERLAFALPETGTTPDSGTTTASRQTLFAGEACRRACAAAMDALRDLGTSGPPAFPLAPLAGRIFEGEFAGETDPFDSPLPHPVRHVAYSYACHVAALGEDGRLERVVAVHDSGLVVNPLAFEGQVEGGVVMGLGYALTEDLGLVDCVPAARFGSLGLLRATEVPPIEVVSVRRAGPGSALDGGTAGAAYGAKGIGEISAIPTAAAVALAYFAAEGRLRRSLPLDGTPYRPAGKGAAGPAAG